MRTAAMRSSSSSHEQWDLFFYSTLELGIDIGDIDVVLLIGPPEQRIVSQRTGRAGRRSHTTRIACFYRTELEPLQFEALLAAETDPAAISSTATLHPWPIHADRWPCGRSLV